MWCPNSSKWRDQDSCHGLYSVYLVPKSLLRYVDAEQAESYSVLLPLHANNAAVRGRAEKRWLSSTTLSMAQQAEACLEKSKLAVEAMFFE